MTSLSNSTLYLKSPLQLELRIIDACNLDCKYCYAKPFLGDKISVDDYTRIIDEALALEVFEIYISGGEPMAHPNILQFLRYALQKPFTVHLLTNGTLITKTVAGSIREMLNMPGADLNVHVSLDSIRPEINDETRGYFYKVTEGINNLLEVGILPSISVVVTSKNIDYIPELIEHYYPRIREFNIMTLILTQEAWKNKALLIDSDYWKKWHVLRQKLLELKGLHNDLSIAAMEDISSLHKGADESWNGVCTAGELRLVVKSNLDVLVCNIAPSLIVGNLKKSTLNEVWNSEFLTRMRMTEHEPFCKRDLEKARLFCKVS